MITVELDYETDKCIIIKSVSLTNPYNDETDRVKKLTLKKGVIVIADRDNIIGVGDYRLIFRGVPLAARVAKPLAVYGISAEKAADGVADKAFYLALKVSPADGNVLILDLGGQLVLQAVDADKNAV